MELHRNQARRAILLCAFRISLATCLDPSEIKFVAATDGEAQRLRLHDGDLLFVRTNGDPDYVGRSAVFNAENIPRRRVRT